jgi:hypothetical protein
LSFSFFFFFSSKQDKAGGLLAEVLEARVHGSLPVTLIGVSTGSRVIFSALQQMKTKGIVENVILIGAPVSNDTKVWKSIKMLVSHRLINVYSSKDWALRLLFRMDQFAIGCAGLMPIDDAESFGVEQFDCQSAHFSLQKTLGNILKSVL